MRFLHTDSAPEAIGPYSQAVAVHGWLYTSGQVGIDPATGELVEGGFEAQARRVFENLRQVLASAGCNFQDVVKATVYVMDMADFPKLSNLCRGHGRAPAARSTVAGGGAPRGRRCDRPRSEGARRLIPSPSPRPLPALGRGI